MNSDNIESEEANICRGYIANATKSGIIFGQNHKNGRELKKLQKLITKEAEEEFLRRQGYRKPTHKTV